MFRPTCLALLFAGSALAQNLLPTINALRLEGHQSDFPSICTDGDGRPWVAFIQWDGKEDSLHVARQTDGPLSDRVTVGQPGIIHQPSIVRDGSGNLHVFWSQVNENNIMELKCAQVPYENTPAKIQQSMTLASSPKGGSAFAKAAVDPAGNVWVVWQGMYGTLGDVFCRIFDSKKNSWSNDIKVTSDLAGDWEPCVAFDGKGGAWICYGGIL